MNKLRTILIRLKVLQVVSNEQRTKEGLDKLGEGYLEAYRLNPFNPLNYIAFILIAPIAIVYVGIIELQNPFKWN